MKKIFKKLIFVFAPVIAFFVFSVQVNAQVLPTVEFEQSPLFSDVNFVPGESVTRWVRLNNKTELSHRAILRATNVTGTGNLENAIGLVIKQGDVILYDNTFANLFSLSELVLPQVGAGGSATFDFIATFIPTAGNEYQNSTMGFNLEMGLEDTNEVLNDTVSIGGQQSGGGGGAYFPVTVGQKSLIIRGESANSAEIQSTSAVISWFTNIPSTSQVVYGLVSGSPYPLNLTLANFGYPLGTIEDLNKVTNHSVTLTGLIYEQPYYYRVISRASPPTVSYEHTFILKRDNRIQVDPVLAVASVNPVAPQINNGENNLSQQNGIGGAPSLDNSRNNENTGSQNAGGTTENSTVNSKIKKTGGAVVNLVRNFGQAAASFLGLGALTWKSGFGGLSIFILFVLLFLAWKNKNKQDK